MKLKIQNLTLFTVCLSMMSVCLGGQVQYYGPADYKKFPDYGCQIRLPDKDDWKWGDPKQGPEGTVALAQSKDGMILLLGIEKRTDDISFEDYVAECDEETGKQANIRNLSSKKLTFLDVPAYDTVAVNTDSGSRAFMRGFLKNQTEYGLGLVVPKSVRINRPMMENIFGAFSWMLTDEERKAKVEAEKQALRDSFVYKEDTTPDTTVYTAPDAKTVQFKEGDLTFQIDLATHKWVDPHNRPTYAFFNILARKEDLEKPKGFTTNIPAWVQIAPLKQTLEAAIEARKKQIDMGQYDAIIVKEIGPGDAKKGNRTVILLYVRDFHDGKPCTYFGIQFVEVGDYVMEIEADCAQGMQMDTEYKTLLNNVLQSALRSLQVNGNPVDTSVLARHVRKK